MEAFNKINALKIFLREKKEKGKYIGFVPTMGALHEGHLSLLEHSHQQNDITVVSIFVNPTQFNDPNDLKKYPRTLNKDLHLLEQKGCDAVFIPIIEEIYPEAENHEINFDIGYLDSIMEGKNRPGHFKGVVQVVYRLFDIVKPDKAYFGEKDFQQLAVIKKMTSTLELPVDIIACPIIRETDGLAMSSRNQLLTQTQRKSAGLINKILAKAKEKRNELSVPALKNWVVSNINENPFLQTEYFEIVDEKNFQPVENWNQTAMPRAFIAVKTGSVRLIDNMKFYS
ncbi:MAG: pantoate--beta-alanine ligase [Bacteroidota bacterium]